MTSDPATQRLRVGLVPVFDCARERPQDLVAELEALGVESLWAPGHVATGRPVPEAITGAARLAALSQRATVGTAVLLAPLYHPVIVAKQFAELDRMTGGRVSVGVGIGGEYEMEFDACQVQVADRARRCEEAIDIMRQLWSGGEVDHHGSFWQLRGVSIEPRPIRPGGPPILIAGRSDAPMRRAARIGDGWFPFLYSPRRYAESVATITDAANAAGRALSDFEWLCFVYVSIDDDPAVARAKALDFIGRGQAGDGARFERLVERVAACGDPDRVAEALQSYVDAGVRHLVLLCCERHDQGAAMRRLMNDVVPRVDVARAEV